LSLSLSLSLFCFLSLFFPLISLFSGSSLLSLLSFTLNPSLLLSFWRSAQWGAGTETRAAHTHTHTHIHTHAHIHTHNKHSKCHSDQDPPKKCPPHDQLCPANHPCLSIQQALS